MITTDTRAAFGGRTDDQIDDDIIALAMNALESRLRKPGAAMSVPQTVDELVHQMGMSRGRATKIVEARRAKAELIEAVWTSMQSWETATSRRALTEFGATLFDLKRMKPKELRELQGRVAARLEHAAGNAVTA